MIATKKRGSLTRAVYCNLDAQCRGGLYVPLTTIYMNKTLGKSLTMAGAVMLLMSLMMMVGNYVGGVLFDRWSPYLTGVLGAGLSLIAMILLIFFSRLADLCGFAGDRGFW